MQVERYLQEPCIEMENKCLHYWNENEAECPHLSKLAKIYVCIPATSAPVKRLFSIAGKTIEVDCQMTPMQLRFVNILFEHNRHKRTFAKCVEASQRRIF